MTAPTGGSEEDLKYWPDQKSALRDAIAAAEVMRQRCAKESPELPEEEAGWYWTIQRLKHMLAELESATWEAP